MLRSVVRSGAALVVAALAACRGSGSHEQAKSDAVGAAGGAYLVRDVHPFEGDPVGPNPGALVAVGDVVFFKATDGSTGMELWKTDGSAGGTALVRDVCPGACSSSYGDTIPPVMAAVNGVLFFVASDRSSGLELWRSDGTSAGTYRVKDVTPGEMGTDLSDMTEAGGLLWFHVRPDWIGITYDLWVSDGTDAGTVPFHAADPGASVIAALGGTTFIRGGYGTELWKTDGTEAGTFLVKNLSPSGSPRGVVFQGKVWFGASSGYHLWSTDGTEAGTVPFGPIGAGDYGASNVVVVGDSLYFVSTVSGTTTLFRTDGTSIVPLTASSSQPFMMGVVNGKLLFSVSSPGLGREPWVADGETTALLADIAPGTVSSQPGSAVMVGGQAYFPASEGTGSAIWRTDGTAAGTARAMSFPCPWPFLQAAGGRLVFAESAVLPGCRSALYSSDGTEAGTIELPIMATGIGLSRSVAAAGGTVFFQGNDAIHGDQPWKSDGTEAGTVPAANVLWARSQTSTGPGAPVPAQLSFVGIGEGRALFAATDASLGRELWVTDGTDAGTSLVRDIAAGTLGSHPFRAPGGDTAVVVLGNVAVFAANDGLVGSEPWRSDGTLEGTYLLVDAWPSPDGSGPTLFATALGKIWFSNGAPWVTDTTVAGTTRLSGLHVTNDLLMSGGPAFVEMGGAVYFGGHDASGSGLFRSDGTSAGTSVVKRFAVDPYHLGVAAGRVWFTATDANGTRGLWTSDGTEAGTTVVGPVPRMGPPLEVNGRLMFLANDLVHGWEPWASDGTPAGTGLVRDILPGPVGSVPDGWNATLLAVPEAGVAVFAASDGAHGMELWESDGTEAGTVMIQDIWPGVRSSSPQALARAGSRIFFLADDGVHARELWAIPIQALDIHPPTISCPAPVSVDAGAAGGAVATFAATATDDLTPADTVVLSYSQAPGTTFPVGTTTVTATAADANGNSATCSFAVTVTGTMNMAAAVAPSTGCSSDGGAGLATLLGLGALFAQRLNRRGRGAA